jgi:hypothetical protein
MKWSTSSDGHPSAHPAAPSENPESLPTQHRLRTTQCPSLPRLLSTGAWDHSPSERAHTMACSYCQKVMAMAWRYECPGVGVLVSDLAGLSPAERAMQEHLEEDRCQRCLRLRRSPLLRSAAAALRAGQRSVQGLEAWLEEAVVLTTRLPTGVGTFAAFDQGPFRVRAESPGGLVTVVRETDRGLLVVEIESADPRHAGRTVHVEVLGQGDPLEVDLVLEAEDGRCIARHTVGHFSDLAARLGTSCEVLAVLPADEPHP